MVPNIDPEQVRKLAGWGLTQNDILPWHRRSSYEPDAPARGVPQSPRWRVGLVCAKDAKLSCRGNSQLRRLESVPHQPGFLINLRP